MEIPKQLQNKDFRFVPIQVGTKKPIGYNWSSTNNYRYYDNFLDGCEAYGVVGGFGNLYVVDFDDEGIQNTLLEVLPETFAVRSGGRGLLHLYFISETPPKSFKIVDKEKRTLLDVQGIGKQVIGANSMHCETRKLYEVVKDVPILTFDILKLRDLFKEFEFKEFAGGQGSSAAACIGKCAFHSDNNPSMAIYPDTGTFYCFGCGAYGFMEVLDNPNGAQKLPTKHGTMYYFEDEDIKRYRGLKSNGEIKKPNNVGLQELYSVYKKWLHIEDENRIDVILATALTRELKGTKIWLIMVGASGDGKSEQINALSSCDYVKMIQEFTAKTLVSGNPKVQDLAPKIQDHILLISDMAQILKLNPNEKAQVWAQLRNLYDGYAGKQSGLGKDTMYSNLNITLIAGATPAIDDQILVHQDLGTRELIFRTKENDNEKTMEKIEFNEKNEVLMREEISSVTTSFIKTHKYNDNVAIPKHILDKIKAYCVYLAIMRASVSVDSYSGELINKAMPERPTRILKQFMRLYKALKSLDVDYSDEKAIGVIKAVVEGSSYPNRVLLFKKLLANNYRMHTQEISKEMKVGWKTAYKELNILWNLGLVTRDIEKDKFERDIYYWYLNDCQFVSDYKKMEGDGQEEIGVCKK